MNVNAHINTNAMVSSYMWSIMINDFRVDLYQFLYLLLYMHASVTEA